MASTAQKLTGRTHLPGEPSIHSLPAMQRPPIFLEFAKQTIVLIYCMSWIPPPFYKTSPCPRLRTDRPIFNSTIPRGPITVNHWEDRHQ